MRRAGSHEDHDGHGNSHGNRHGSARESPPRGDATPRRLALSYFSPAGASFAPEHHFFGPLLWSNVVYVVGRPHRDRGPRPHLAVPEPRHGRSLVRRTRAGPQAGANPLRYLPAAGGMPRRRTRARGALGRVGRRNLRRREDRREQARPGPAAETPAAFLLRGRTRRPVKRGHAGGLRATPSGRAGTRTPGAGATPGAEEPDARRRYANSCPPPPLAAHRRSRSPDAPRVPRRAGSRPGRSPDWSPRPVGSRRPASGDPHRSTSDAGIAHTARPRATADRSPHRVRARRRAAPASPEARTGGPGAARPRRAPRARRASPRRLRRRCPDGVRADAGRTRREGNARARNARRSWRGRWAGQPRRRQ